jgi:hypothetical protein
MGIEVADDQDRKRVTKPKVVAKTTFKSEEGLVNERKFFFKSASEVCSILFFQSFAKA